jgi:N-acetylneuraminic acid mutarotase
VLTPALAAGLACGKERLVHTQSFLAVGALLLAALGCHDGTGSPTEPAAPGTPEFGVASNTWLTRANMQSDRYSPTVAVVTSAQGLTTLYAIGGHTSGGPFCSGAVSKVQAYNASTDTWTTKAPLPIQLTDANGAGVINGKIYVSGGCFNYKNYSNWLLMYNPATNTWTRKRDLPITGFDGATGVIDNKLYVITSCHGQEDCYYGDYSQTGHPDRWLFRYDPATDTWSELAIPPRTHGKGVAGTIGGKLYVVGGDFGTRALDVYDPATNTWTARASMGSDRWGAAGTALAGKLYVIGGVDSSFQNVSTTNVYDPTTNTWRRRAPMPTARGGMAAGRVIVNGQARLQVVGGARPGNNLQYVP